LVAGVGLYVGIVGSRGGPEGGDSPPARFRRGARRSFVGIDWVAAVWGGVLVMVGEFPTGWEILVGTGFVVAAAWLGAFVVRRKGREPGRWRFAGLLVAMLPLAFIGGVGEWRDATHFLVYLVPGPAGIQVLLMGDFLLMSLSTDAESLSDEGEGTEPGFEVVGSAQGDG
jgi:hypothetical protein